MNAGACEVTVSEYELSWSETPPNSPREANINLRSSDFRAWLPEGPKQVDTPVQPLTEQTLVLEKTIGPWKRQVMQ